MEQYIADVQALVATYGMKIIAALAIFVVGRWLARVLSKAFGRALERTGTDKTLVRFSVNLTFAALLVFVVLAVLGQLGIQTASFVVVIGAAGLAVGFALQGSLSNFAAGVMLILFRPFKVGDYIEAGGAAGTVEEIMIFSTRMKTPDNRAIFVPNGSITAGNIVNASANDTRRVDMVFGIGYDDDIPRVIALLHEILASDPRVLEDPAPTIGVIELADSSVNIAVRPWVQAADYWGLYFDMHKTVKLRFDAAGISIPYPQHELHMRQVAQAA
jgi:small conductance mechanosensitive channel